MDARVLFTIFASILVNWVISKTFGMENSSLTISGNLMEWIWEPGNASAFFATLAFGFENLAH